MKTTKVIIATFLLLTFAFAKSAAWKMAEPVTLQNNTGDTAQVAPTFDQSRTDREEIDLITIDFEGDVSDWDIQYGWELTETDYNSETHSLMSPNSMGDGIYSVISPTLTMPPLGDGEILHYAFFLNIDAPDTDGDGDNFLEDYWWLDIADADALAWHTSDYNSFEDNSYWCSDESLGPNGGYSDGWLQYLDTPSINIPDAGYTLSADMYWAIEEPCGYGVDCGVEGMFVDGWDAANVRVSADGGATWEAIEGSDPYDFMSGYGWVFNQEEEYIPGWGGFADWHNVEFDLSAYAGQDLMVRFAFGADAGFSTIDDGTLTGFQVDNILVSNGTDDIFYANADQDPESMVPAGLQWQRQMYDYGDEDRPGGLGWTEYLPGYPFCTGCNVFLDISDMAEHNIVFKFTSRYDDNDDGGVGAGMFFDDLRIYKETTASYMPPAYISGEALAGECYLEWEDMNASGTFDYQFDNDAVTDGIVLNGDGLAFAGEEFAIVGNSTVESVDIFNVNMNSVNVTLGGFAAIGAFYNSEPGYEMDVTLDAGTWTTIDLTGWDFTGPFLLGYTFDAEVSAGLDVSVNPSMYSWVKLNANWERWPEAIAGSDLSDGEWGIRATINQTGANVTYNLYRDDMEIPYASNIDDNFYSDTDVENNTEYAYAVSSVYDNGEESPLTEVVELIPQSDTIYEISYDDGSAEAGVRAGSGNFLAVRFTPASNEIEDLVRLKWYQQEAGGAFYLKLFADDGGLPGEEIYSQIFVGAVLGWNTYDVAEEGFAFDGPFWFGVKEFSSTREFGLDTDSDTGNSYYRIGTGGAWEPVSGLGMGGNAMFRVLLDGVEQGGCDDILLGDVNLDTLVDVLDVVGLVNIVMDGNEVSDDVMCGADVNMDTVLDVLDIVGLVNIIMN